jgi:hypothetical protein
MIPEDLKYLLPTRTALLSLAGIVMVSPVAFHSPGYFPEDWWGGSSLALFQARLLFGLLPVVLLLMVALLSVGNECRRLAQKLAEAEKLMKSQELIEFAKEINKIQSQQR